MTRLTAIALDIYLLSCSSSPHARPLVSQSPPFPPSYGADVMRILWLRNSILYGRDDPTLFYFGISRHAPEQLELDDNYPRRARRVTHLD